MIFLLFLPLMALAQDFADKSFTVGTRSSYFTGTENWDNTFLYYVPEYTEETFSDSISQRRKVKLRVLDYVSSNEEVIVDPLDVSMEFFTNNNSFQVGFLRYRFSETFGLQLLDVANPRDYSEFIFNDLSWSKRSVFGLNDTYKWKELELQLILTLWPNGDRMPYKDSAFDPTDGQIDYQGGVIARPWFKDLEYGTRLKHLFENGLDLSFLYYHHFARPTFHTIKIISPTHFKAEPTDHLVDSLGGAASFVWNEWVLRADVLYTINDLIQKDLLSYKKNNHLQTLAGIDRSFENFLLGLQVQDDFSSDRHFYGIRSEYTNHGRWKPSVMVFRGLEANDQWLQLKSLLDFADWKFSMTFDNIHGGKEEKNLFGFYRSQDRFLLDVNFTY